MKAMETIQDLIEEAKVRAVWWCLCIFSVTYFLTRMSNSEPYSLRFRCFMLLSVISNFLSLDKNLYNASREAAVFRMTLTLQFH